MAIIKLQANFDIKTQKEIALKVKPGILGLMPKDFYLNDLTKVLKMLNKKQFKSGKKIDIDVTLDIHFKKRTLDQNSLMWALYAILADVLNEGQKGHKDQMVSSMQLYLDDLEEYAEKIDWIIPKEKELLYMQGRRVAANEFHSMRNGKEYIKLTVYESSSHFTTKQMTAWIERLFNTLAHLGVPISSSSEIKSKWQQWRQHLNDENISLHDDEITIDDYRELNPICEGCGEKYLVDGLGQICHIKARGMGGNHGIEKDKASNLLHLCTDCHILTQHQKGWECFKKKAPHLTNKINRALKQVAQKNIFGE